MIDMENLKTPFGLIISQDYEPHEAASQWVDRLGVFYSNALHVFRGTRYRFLVLAVHTPARLKTDTPEMFLCIDEADLSRTLKQIDASVPPPIRWRCAVKSDSPAAEMLLELIPSHLIRLMNLETYQSMAPRIQATMEASAIKKQMAAKKANARAKKARKQRARAIKAEVKAQQRKKKPRAKTRSTRGKSLTTP